MLRLDEIRARLEDRVAALAGSIGNAAEFAQLVERRQLPQWRAGAFILPGGLVGSGAQAMAGAFVQGFQETVSIVLVTRVQGDPTGARALDELTPLIRAVVEAICGWGPDNSPGVFALASGELVGSQEGTLIFQIDFALSDQLRIFA